MLNLRFTKHGVVYGTGSGILSVAACLIIFISSCKITQELGTDEVLVNRARIEGINEPEKRDDARTLIQQKPNKKLFGFWRFYLRAYNYGMRGDTSRKFRRYFRKIGEPPVILDSAKLDSSAGAIKAYLFNNGYYDATVTYTVKLTGRRKKKATIEYKVDQKQPYRIRNIEYGISDRDVYYKVMQDTANSLIKSGDIFEAEEISRERERITARFRNEGYYQFSREYIAFTVDSSLAGNYVDITLQIRNPETYRGHSIFTISNVYVNVINRDVRDTTGEFERWHLYDSLWINLNKYPLREDILASNILVRPGDLFSQVQVDNTYSRLNDIMLLQQASVTFEMDTSAPGTLLCFIALHPGKRQEVIYEPQIITSDQNNAVEQANQRNYGIANAVTYRNKNLFRRAESFDLRYRISLEGQFRFNDSIPFFNNIENNFSTSLALPRIMILRGLQRKIEIRSTKTTIIGSYIYESNIDFNRQVISLSYNEFFKRVFNGFNFTWLEVSFNKVDAKRNFLSLVNPADSIFVANLFVTNLIANSRFTWLYSDRFLVGARNNFSARTMLEPAGNTLYALYTIMGMAGRPAPPDGVYKIDNVNFEQYIKIDEDIQFSQVINSISSFASRLHLGVGLPYGNSKIMPFVRRYFIGGANSLRGWRPRTLGPGSFTNTEPGVRADRSGEMIIEAQAEYRFVLIENLLNGALFMDAGNIWYTKPVEGREGAHFRMGTFMNEMAVDAGFGARFDFSFFVVRLDFGLPLRNPELPSRTRWLFDDYGRRDKKVFRSIVFNLGLGYPF